MQKNNILKKIRIQRFRIQLVLYYLGDRVLHVRLFNFWVSYCNIGAKSKIRLSGIRIGLITYTAVIARGGINLFPHRNAVSHSGLLHIVRGISCLNVIGVLPILVTSCYMTAPGWIKKAI